MHGNRHVGVPHARCTHGRICPLTAGRARTAGGQTSRGAQRAARSTAVCCRSACACCKACCAAASAAMVPAGANSWPGGGIGGPRRPAAASAAAARAACPAKQPTMWQEPSPSHCLHAPARDWRRTLRQPLHKQLAFRRARLWPRGSAGGATGCCATQVSDPRAHGRLGARRAAIF